MKISVKQKKRCFTDIFFGNLRKNGKINENFKKKSVTFWKVERLYKVDEEEEANVMKKKIMIPIMLMTLICGIPAEASDVTEKVSTGVMVPCYENISNAKISIEITGNNATCYATVASRSVQDIKITLTLQKKSGTSWTNITSWTTSKNDAKACSLTKTKSISTGTYRTKAILKCGNETITKYSGTKTK